MIFRSEAPTASHPNQHADYPDPDYHMQRMNTGHREIEPVKQLDVSRIAGSLPLELLKPRHKMMSPFVVVLVSFYPQKGQAEKLSEHQKGDQVPPIPDLRKIDRQRHRQAADDQDNRVEKAELPFQVRARSFKGLRVLSPIQDVRQKQPAKEHHFGDQKRPHPERSSFALLLYIVKVMRKPAVCCDMCICQSILHREDRGSRVED